MDSNMFWANVNGIYQLRYKNDYNIALAVPSLPSFPRYREQDLKALGIYYEDNGTRLITYNPQVVEWENFTAPLRKLTVVNRVGPFLGYYSGKVPSVKMLMEANSYFMHSKQRLEDFILAKEKEEFESYFATHSADGICCWWSEDDYALLSAENMEEKYFAFNLASPGNFFEGLIILRPVLKAKTIITIKVPKVHISKVIGLEASTISRLSKELGLKYIKVEAYD